MWLFPILHEHCNVLADRPFAPLQALPNQVAARAPAAQGSARAHPLVGDAAVRGGGRLRRVPLRGRALRRHVPAEPGDLRLRRAAGPQAGDPLTHPVGTPLPDQPWQAGRGWQRSTPRRAPPRLTLAW